MAVCATLEFIEILKAAVRGGEVPSCPWCGAARPAVSFEPGAGLLFYCPACGVGFTWAFGRERAACAAL
jgi:hypothetical protein